MIAFANVEHTKQIYETNPLTARPTPLKVLKFLKRESSSTVYVYKNEILIKIK